MKIVIIFFTINTQLAFSQEIKSLYNLTRFSHGYSVSEYLVNDYSILNYWGLPAFNIDGDNNFELPILKSPGLDYRNTGIFKPGMNFQNGEVIYDSNNDFLFLHSPIPVDVGRDGTIDGFISRGGDDPYYFPQISNYAKSDYREYFESRGAIDYSNILLCDFAVTDRWFNGLLTIYHPIAQYYKKEISGYEANSNLVSYDETFNNKLGEKYGQQTNIIDGDINGDGLQDFIVWGGSGVDGSECTETLSGIENEIVNTDNKYLGLKVFFGQQNGSYNASILNYSKEFIASDNSFQHRDHPIFGDGNAGILFDFDGDGTSEIFTEFRYDKKAELGFYDLDLNHKEIVANKIQVEGGYRLIEGQSISEKLQTTQFVEFYRDSSKVKFFMRYTITHDYYPTEDMGDIYVLMAYEINTSGLVKNITEETFPNKDNTSKHLTNWSSMYMIDLDFDGDLDLYIQDGENGSAFGKQGLEYGLNHHSWVENNAIVYFENLGSSTFKIKELANLGPRMISSTPMEEWDLNDLNDGTHSGLVFEATNSMVDRMLPDYNRYMPINYDNDNTIDFFSGGSYWGENSLKIHSSKDFPDNVIENFGGFSKYRIVAPNTPLNQKLNEKLSLVEYDIKDGIPIELSDNLVIEVIDETKRGDTFKPRSIITVQDPSEKYAIYTWNEAPVNENWIHSNVINFNYGKGNIYFNQDVIEDNPDNQIAKDRLEQISSIVESQGSFNLIRSIYQQYDPSTYYTKTDTIKVVKKNIEPTSFQIINAIRFNEGYYQFEMEKSFDPDSNDFDENNSNVTYWANYLTADGYSTKEIDDYTTQSDSWNIAFNISESNLLWIEFYVKEKITSDVIIKGTLSENLMVTETDFDKDGKPDLFDLDDDNDGVLDNNDECNFTEIGAKIKINGCANNKPSITNIETFLNEDTSLEITLTGIDEDEDTLTFSVGEPANGSVSLEGAVVTYTPNANFNGSDSFTYTANDGTVDSEAARVTITVTPVADAPKFSMDTEGSISEDATIGAIIASLEASDGDGDELTFSLSNNSDNIFAISEGSLVLNQVLDYESVTSHSVTITVSDGELTDTIDYKLNVIDVPNNSVEQEYSITVYDVENEDNTEKLDYTQWTSSTEGSGSGDFIFEISGGEDAVLFTIDPVTGALDFIEAPDYENPSDANGDNVYIVIVKITNINDGAPEIPVVSSQTSVAVPESQTAAADVDAINTTNKTDTDEDGVVDTEDNCPTMYNPGQEDIDDDGVGDVCDDSDMDTFFDVFDQCPNSDYGVTVDAKGCEVFALPANTFSVTVSSATCPDASNGSITISTSNTDYSYRYALNDQAAVALTDNSQTISNLSAGIYTVCVTVDGVSDYERCYTIEITEPAPLVASSRVDVSSRNMQLDLSGALEYQVTLNGKTFLTTEAKLSLNLEPGMNRVEVSTSLDCQGIYFEEIFVSEAVKVYPNPTAGPLQLFVAGSDGEVELRVTTLSGNVVSAAILPVPANRIIETSLGNLPQGMYLITLRGTTVKTTHKIIKE